MMFISFQAAQPLRSVEGNGFLHVSADFCFQGVWKVLYTTIT